jgi:hypothetical protein
MFEKYVIQHMRFIQGEQEVQAMSQPQMPQAASPDQMAGAMEGPTQGPVPIQNPEQMGNQDQTYNLQPIR